MRQKYGKLTFVHVTDKMPPEMAHFECDFDGIVDGTYSQMYGGTNIDSYGLWVIRDGKVIDYGAWYCEDQLTELPEQDRDKAEQMIEDYHFRT